MTPDTAPDAPHNNVSTDLAFRAARILTGEHVEDCYDAEFARSLAVAAESDQMAEVEAIYRKLQKKFKDFRVSHLQTMVRSERNRITAAAAQSITRPGWERQLIRRPGKDGEPGPLQLCEMNAMLYFENHPEWHGAIGYNRFTAQHAVLKPTPLPVKLKPGDALEDHHDTQFAAWLQSVTGQSWRVDMVRRAMDCWARDNSFHPVRDYLDGLKWDGHERLKTWLFDYAGAGPGDADDDPDAPLMDFMAAAGERWMISAVARIRNPGCEVHHMLVLEGGEGLGKSMLVKKLGRGYSQVMKAELDSRSAQELIASAVWIWEFAELASLKKTSEVESAKAFITCPEETFRPAYGHRVIKHKRECAFIATVNNDQYFDSSAWEDGKRRMWPIRCTRPFDLDGLENNIDQMWAEADAKYKAGARWHFDRYEDAALINTAKHEQAARVPEHVLSDEFLNAAHEVCETRPSQLYGSVSISEVLAHLKIPLDRRKVLQAEVGRCLRAAGWDRRQMRVGRERVGRYFRVER